MRWRQVVASQLEHSKAPALSPLATVRLKRSLAGAILDRLVFLVTLAATLCAIALFVLATPVVVFLSFIVDLVDRDASFAWSAPKVSENAQ